MPYKFAPGVRRGDGVRVLCPNADCPSAWHDHADFGRHIMPCGNYASAEAFGADAIALIRGLRHNAKPVERSGVWRSVVDDLPRIALTGRKKKKWRRVDNLPKWMYDGI